MIVKQYYLGCLAHGSYLVADETSKQAAIVDPRRDVDEYVEDAKKLGVEIKHVLLTHFHADFVSGHLELRDRCGATIHLGARAKAEYAFSAMKDGAILELGPEVKLQALETPGHTPESTCYALLDRKTSEERPHAVFTGDTLFIGDVGRPDLLASVGMKAEDLAGMLYESLHEKLMKLPDETIVYPAHGAGSLCGKNLSDERSSTIGKQKAGNYALKPMSKGEFVKLVTADQSDAPAYFSYDAELNKKERPTLEQTLAKAVKPLSLEQVLAEQKKGAQVVDTRAPIDFEAAYLAGSINVGLSGKYATWAGSILDRTKPIVIVADKGKETESSMRLGRIGFDGIVGYLEGGIASVEKAKPELVRRRKRVEAKTVAEMLRSKKPPLVLDVRAPGEWNAGHIEGSLNLPLLHLRERVAEVPRDRELVIQCQSGYRSSIAASILAQHGLEGADLVGGIVAWNEAKLPTVSETAKV